MVSSAALKGPGRPLAATGRAARDLRAPDPRRRGGDQVHRRGGADQRRQAHASHADERPDRHLRYLVSPIGWMRSAGRSREDSPRRGTLVASLATSGLQSDAEGCPRALLAHVSGSALSYPWEGSSLDRPRPWHGAVVGNHKNRSCFAGPFRWVLGRHACQVLGSTTQSGTGRRRCVLPARRSRTRSGGPSLDETSRPRIGAR